MTDYQDPLEAAENAQPREFSNDIYGLCALNSAFVVLVKGTGKVPFNPATHKVEDRRTALDFTISPLAETGLQWDVARGMVAESTEFTKIVHPAIKALGVQLRQLNGAFVRVQLVDTGATYTNRSGEVKNKTTIKFMEVYASREACLAAWAAASGYASQAPAAAAPAAPAAQQPIQPTTQPNGGSDKEKQNALAFLKVLVENCTRSANGDLSAARTALATKISGMPPVAKYFTVDSEETLQLLAAALQPK